MINGVRGHTPLSLTALALVAKCELDTMLEASMLAFLDTLCAALIARDVVRIRHLMAHPLSRALPKAVREEATAIAGGASRGHSAPLQAMRLYHQTAHMLGVRSDPAVRPAVRDPGRRQFDLPLEALAPR